MKTQYKPYYRALKKPQILELPKIPIISIKGEGNPNTNPLFESHISALYQLSYGFRMSYRNQPIEGYYTYTVGPLEGFWSTNTGLEYTQDKDTLTYEIFIVQPDFVTEQIFLEYQQKLQSKNDYIKEVEFKYIEEGLCGQILHIGSFDSEPESVAKLEQHLNQEGYKFVNDSHHEIYLSDFRRVTEDKYKTLIRYKIEKV
ncbi:GyrI-like domain-containing protein [Mollicutes bacterium LVI A0078]|nr:GyrI-like domain-containing protein [Mollicutes bacterium LVI A0075]WOO90638.1 GyrI-like domain-containing protein [Mollicutes bacterium LVI A0078]